MNIRFAPTLNNKIHIGNIRILLFNFLIKKVSDKRIILRIDQKEDIDDDVKIYNCRYIIDLCKTYFNICFDDIIYQDQRNNIYHKYLNLIDNRYKIKVNDVIYLDFKELKSLYKTIKYKDIVYGEMKKKSDLISNCPVFNIRSKRFFYNFTSVIDDIDCDVSLIIRGNDHIDNTFLQICIYYLLNVNNKPDYMHIPLCLLDSGEKISKSGNDKILDVFSLIEEYFVLPETIFLYLTGYNMNNDIKDIKEIKISKKNKIISMNTIEQFNIKIIKSIDIEKLKEYTEKIAKVNILKDHLLIIRQFSNKTTEFVQNLMVFHYFGNNKIEDLIKIVDEKKYVNEDIDDEQKATYLYVNKLLNVSVGKEIIEIFKEKLMLLFSCLNQKYKK